MIKFEEGIKKREKMFRIVSVLIFIGLTTCQNFLHISSMRYDKKVSDSPSRAINYHLFDTVGGTGDIGAYMREAKRWYDEEVSKSGDRKLIDTLKLFIDMDDMKMCTEEGQNILAVNRDKARGLIEADGLSTVLSEVVDHYVEKNARECGQVYADNLHEKYNQLEESTKNNLHLFTDQPKFGRFLHNQAFYAVFVVNALRSITEDNPGGEYLGKVANKREGTSECDAPKIKELLNRYLVEPCQKLIEMNSDGWLRRLELDQLWVKQAKPEDDLVDRFSLRYKICQELVGRERKEIEDKVIKRLC